MPTLCPHCAQSVPTFFVPGAVGPENDHCTSCPRSRWSLTIECNDVKATLVREVGCVSDEVIARLLLGLTSLWAISLRQPAIVPLPASLLEKEN